MRTVDEAGTKSTTKRATRAGVEAPPRAAEARHARTLSARTITRSA